MGPDTERLQVAVGQEEIAQMISGVKHDNGKIEGDQIFRAFARALHLIAKVGSFGARKYTMNGWPTVPGGRDRYKGHAESYLNIGERMAGAMLRLIRQRHESGQTAK